MSSRTRRVFTALVVSCAWLVFMAPQAGNSAEYGHITEMHLSASPNMWNGGCPVTINFHGFIRVDGPNTVTYGITRSDGATGAGQQTLHFSSAGTKPVHFNWRLGKAGETLQVWAQIGSGNMRSNKAEVHIHCGL